MLTLLTSLITGPLVASIFDLFKGWQQKALTDDQLKEDLEKTILGTIASATKSAADVITQESKAEDLITRIWRPIVSLGFSFVLFFYVLVVPILVNWFGVPPLHTSDTLLQWHYQLTTICVGGYIGGRSIEKIVDRVWR